MWQPRQNKTTMAASSSLIAELLSAINIPKLRPMPAYLSESDAPTADEYMQDTYAANYVLDTSNAHWGGEVNSSHISDIYSEYHPQKDSVKNRLDMISFVTSNSCSYAWDGHLFLQLNNMTLDTWIKKMSTAETVQMHCLSTH